MTSPQKRQPAGRPTGGQFATQEHAESAITLAERPTVLDGWPESLPDPVVDVTLDPEGGETVTLTVGDDCINVWMDNESTGRLDADAIGFQDVDEDTVEAAMDYACKVYGRVAPAIRAEAKAAVNRSKARIIGAATGTAQPAADDELARIVDDGAENMAQVGRDLEMASASLAARKLKAIHPGAAFVEVITESWEDGNFVDGAALFDADRRKLAEYRDGDEDGQAAEALEYLKNLNPNASTSYWSGLLAVGAYGEDMWLVDIDKAAAWAPGGAR